MSRLDEISRMSRALGRDIAKLTMMLDNVVITRAELDRIRDKWSLLLSQAMVGVGSTVAGRHTEAMELRDVLMSWGSREMVNALENKVRLSRRYLIQTVDQLAKAARQGSQDFTLGFAAEAAETLDLIAKANEAFANMLVTRTMDKSYNAQALVVGRIDWGEFEKAIALGAEVASEFDVNSERHHGAEIVGTLLKRGAAPAAAAASGGIIAYGRPLVQYPGGPITSWNVAGCSVANPDGAALVASPLFIANAKMELVVAITVTAQQYYDLWEATNGTGGTAASVSSGQVATAAEIEDILDEIEIGTATGKVKGNYKENAPAESGTATVYFVFNVQPGQVISMDAPATGGGAEFDVKVLYGTVTSTAASGLVGFGQFITSGTELKRVIGSGLGASLHEYQFPKSAHDMLALAYSYEKWIGSGQSTVNADSTVVRTMNIHAESVLGYPAGSNPFNDEIYRWAYWLQKPVGAANNGAPTEEEQRQGHVRAFRKFVSLLRPQIEMASLDREFLEQYAADEFST